MYDAVIKCRAVVPPWGRHARVTVRQAEAGACPPTARETWRGQFFEQLAPVVVARSRQRHAQYTLAQQDSQASNYHVNEQQVAYAPVPRISGDIRAERGVF